MSVLHFDIILYSSLFITLMGNFVIVAKFLGICMFKKKIIDGLLYFLLTFSICNTKCVL